MPPPSNLLSHSRRGPRRYADVVVHRLLATALRYTALPSELERKESIRAICETINKRNHAAQLVTFTAVPCLLPALQCLSLTFHCLSGLPWVERTAHPAVLQRPAGESSSEGGCSSNLLCEESVNMAVLQLCAKLVACKLSATNCGLQTVG